MTGQASKKIYVIAGEASGDLHGANLIRHLREQARFPLDVYGVGGDRMKASGVKDFYDLAHFHVTGITAAIKTLPKYQKASVTILENIRKARPDLVVLIDNPGFNLHLSKRIHEMGIPIVYFIAPQVWAWAPKRVLTIKKYIKKVLVVFQFEKSFFEEHGIPVAWVGHPLKDLVREELGDSSPAAAPDKKTFLVSLLPGSRKGELKMLFSIFLKAAEKIREKLPEAAFTVIKAPTMPRNVYEERLKKTDVPVKIVEKYTYHTLRESDLAIVCSGTATLECALLGTPMIIVNRGSLVTYIAAKSLVRVKFLGLPNLILGERKFPELLQYDATPKKIAEAAVKALTDKKTRQEMKKACEETSKRIGETGASKRAAEEVLKLL